jgi:hypothetical protein
VWRLMCVYLVQELVLNLEQGIELVPESHGMDDHRIVAVEVQDADLQERAVAVRAENIRTSSMSKPFIGLRTAWNMSSSSTPCFRAGSPTRI